MDMVSKIAVGLGGLGLAAVTGAWIQSSIDEREENRRQLRDKIYDLESKSSEMSCAIEAIKRNDDRQNDRIDEVNSRVRKLEMKQAIEKA